MTRCRWTCRRAIVPPLSGSSNTFLGLCDPEHECNTIFETSVSTRPATKQNTPESPETRTDSRVQSWLGKNIRHKISRITLGPCGARSVSHISAVGTTRNHTLSGIQDRPETHGRSGLTTNLAPWNWYSLNLIGLGRGWRSKIRTFFRNKLFSFWKPEFTGIVLPIIPVTS